MPTIPVETFTVRVARNTSGPFARLTIAGPVLTHGIQSSATLHFFPSTTALVGWVLHADGTTGAGVEIFAQLPFSDFTRMYDLLRAEAPLWLAYTHRSGPTTTKPLSTIALESGSEPPGEGPQDAEAVERSFATLATRATPGT